jgi:hypothetical protein
MLNLQIDNQELEQVTNTTLLDKIKDHATEFKVNIVSPIRLP